MPLLEAGPTVEIVDVPTYLTKIDRQLAALRLAEWLGLINQCTTLQFQAIRMKCSSSVMIGNSMSHNLLDTRHTFYN